MQREAGRSGRGDRESETGVAAEGAPLYTSSLPSAVPKDVSPPAPSAGVEGAGFIPESFSKGRIEEEEEYLEEQEMLVEMDEKRKGWQEGW